jgi:Nif-specific regulatory protein
MPATPVAYIVTITDDGYGQYFGLQKGVHFTIGRSPSNRIVLADDLCSREHAEIFDIQGQWYVRDLGSLNGSRLNDSPIRKDEPLASSDEIRLGHSRFRFVTDINQLPALPAHLAPGNDHLEIKKRLRNTKFTSGNKKHSPPGEASATLHEPERYEEAMSTLYRLALDLGRVESQEELVELALDGLLEGTPCEVVAILAVTEARETQLLANRYRHKGPDTYHKVSQFVSSEVLSTREAILAENVHTNPALRNRESLSELKVGSLICAPIAHETTVFGLIHIYSTAFQKPLTNEHLEFTLAVARQVAVTWHQLKRRGELFATNRYLAENLRLDSELVGESPPLKQIESQIARVAETQATVLIRGESGSGKELVARAIHFSSPRSNAPFVTLNCAAITESLLESELFGHEKGAYTGATEKMIGKFEAADGGTIFLDEIGEMPLTTQSKFLRVLEGHPFERLGGNNKIQVDVRVVAATNRALEEAVRSNQFRKDLFYRLQVVEIRVPPLRERNADIPQLAEHFLKRFSRDTGRKIRGFTPDAVDKLQKYHWPGNVRELRNVIERAVALNLGPMLDASDIWLSSLDVESGTHPALYQPVSLEEVEKHHIMATLQFTDWNKSKAADILGIERSTLDRKIKSYDLKRDL